VDRGPGLALNSSAIVRRIYSALPASGTEVRSKPAGPAAGPGALVVEVRIRLGSSIARLAPAPVMTMQLPAGATVADVRQRLASSNPELAHALQSAVAIVGGSHADPRLPLAAGDEVALLAPMSGG
jgi:molybdopterin converting factor small subunit